jgi:hypothetical protein
MVTGAVSADSVMGEIVAWTEANGGYYTSLESRRSMTLRVPAAKLDSLAAKMQSLGLGMRKSVYATDRTAELAALTAKINSSRKLLDEFLGMAKTTGYQQMQSIERECVNLVSQIELAEGQKRGIERRVQLAQVSIDLWLEEPSSTRSSVIQSSPFPWLNDRTIHLLWRDFQ